MVRVVGAALLLFSLSACQALLGIEDTSVGEPEEPAPGTPGFTFAVVTTNPALPLDGTGVIEVAINRSGGFDGAVEVKPTFVPTGLVAPAIIIPSGSSTGELAVGAVAPLFLGAELTFELQASADALPMRFTEVTKALITGKPGAFDASFGASGTGLVRLSFGADDAGAFEDLQLTANNTKLVVAGYGVGGAGSVSQALARLSIDGIADTTFNAAGSPAGQLRVTFAGTSGEDARAPAIGFQADGRMITIGFHGNGTLPSDAAFARVSLAGAVGDNDFGNYVNGKSRVDLGGDQDRIYDGVVLRSGAAVGVGAGRNGEGPEWLAVTKVDLSGFPDGGFGGTGLFSLQAEAQPSRGEAVLLDGKDRLVVAGSIGAPGARDVLVLRFTAAGALDESFGTGGRVVLGLPTVDERPRALALRPDGRIVIAGTSNKNGGADIELRQLLESGQPDESFGQGGVSTPPLPGGAVATDMTLLPNGRIVVVGNSGNTPMIARYTKSGALDPYFSGDGVDSVPFGSYGTMRGVRVSPDGRKVFLCGGDEGASPGPGTFGIIARMWM